MPLLSLPGGNLVFCGLRGADPFLQHAFLVGGLGKKLIGTLGSSTVAQGPLTNTGIRILDGLQTTPYRLILLSMAGSAALKHIYWKLVVAQEETLPKAAVVIGVFNGVLDSINSLLFVCALTSPAFGRGEGPDWSGWPGAPLLVGGSLFTTGLILETVSETQRKNFKQSDDGKGLPYTGGLFGLSRHINYFGYMLWRGGWALAAGGWIWGGTVAGFFAYDFLNRAIPELDQYCSSRVCQRSSLLTICAMSRLTLYSTNSTQMLGETTRRRSHTNLCRCFSSATERCEMIAKRWHLGQVCRHTSP